MQPNDAVKLAVAIRALEKAIDALQSMGPQMKEQGSIQEQLKTLHATLSNMQSFQSRPLTPFLSGSIEYAYMTTRTTRHS
jgi:hypothetical protein